MKGITYDAKCFKKSQESCSTPFVFATTKIKIYILVLPLKIEESDINSALA